MKKSSISYGAAHREVLEQKIKNLLIDKVIFAPIEFFDWSCLTIGALGWGQIQIANANIVKLVSKNSRKKWMLQLCDTMLEFYPKEMVKISERIERFKKLRAFWRKKEE